MRATFDNRSVAGTVTCHAVVSPVSRSTAALADTATPKRPIALGTMLVLSFGATPVPHSPSARVRVNCALASTGRTTSTTQAGDTAATRSRLPADEIQDSTLHAPGSE